MLTHFEYALITENKLSFQMASVFHGALMERLPAESATELHRSGLHPFTQHLELRGKQWVWVLNALDSSMADLIQNALKDHPVISLKSHDLSIQVTELGRTSISAASLNDIFYQGNANRFINLQFVTPTAFKRQGEYLFYPDLYCIFQSLMNKHDAIFEANLRDEDALEELVGSSKVIHYQLKSTNFSVQGVNIPSFLGRIAIKLSGTDTMTRFANMLTTFGEYSGVGIKTTLGMGAIKVLERFYPEKKEGRR